MPIYCGVDFHARQQTICYCDTANGEIHRRELDHQKDDVRSFYGQLTGEVIVGLEASGYSTWFIEMMEGLAIRCSSATQPRSDESPGVGRRMIDAMPRSSLISCSKESFLKYTAPH